MFLCLIFAVTISACFATDVAVTPPVICGEISDVMYACLGVPILIKQVKPNNCDREISRCDRLTCVFTQSEWIQDGKVMKEKIETYYDQFAKDNPAWLAAVQHAKATCLASDLPAQGVYLNCPAYDIITCTLSTFVKSARASQWNTSARCQYQKRFAEACPMCPSECFAPQVPYGSCNACLALPRSP